MKINCKDIKSENQKTCILCGKVSSNDGIIIKNNHICENCIGEIMLITADDIRYEEIKEKIKDALVSNRF